MQHLAFTRTGPNPKHGTRTLCAVTPSPPHPLTPSSSRRGTTLLELMIAGLLLGTLMAVVVPSLAWVARERLGAEQRQAALIEAANVLERLTTEDWEQITAERTDEIALSPDLSRQLPDAKLEVSIAEDPEQPDAKRIAAAISWRDRGGQRVSPVKLTAWVYRHGRSE